MALSVEDDEKLQQVAGLIEPDSEILFITGAGLSADSGLPTYRGVSGLYVDRETPDGMPIEHILSGETFALNPGLTWSYLLVVARACRDATFNRGHAVIAEMEQQLSRVRVLTQNVDGFHKRAGSKNVIDIHGDIHHLICTGCSWSTTVDHFDDLDARPECPDCQSVIRPDVVLFGEFLPESKIEAFQAEQLQGFDLVFSVGTSSLFPYIQMPVLHAFRTGVPTVEINPDVTELSDIVTYPVKANAAEALDALWDYYRRRIQN